MPHFDALKLRVKLNPSATLVVLTEIIAAREKLADSTWSKRNPSGPHAVVTVEAEKSEEGQEKGPTEVDETSEEEEIEPRVMQPLYVSLHSDLEDAAAMDYRKRPAPPPEPDP